MSNKELKLKGRVQNKHKTEEAWLLDVYPNGDTTLEPRVDAFIPLDGELIIYDPDSVYTERRIKIGDGVTNVVALPWASGFQELEYKLKSNGAGYIVTGLGGCKDQEVRIPSIHNSLPVVEIASKAFSKGQHITSIVVPSSIQLIEQGAFYGCSSLERLTIPFAGTGRGATGASALFGFIFGSESYDGSQETIQYYNAITKNTYYLPVTLREVEFLGEALQYGAFYGCKNLNRIFLSDNLQEIGSKAFTACESLEEISIPESVTEIGQYAFQNCISLKKASVLSAQASIYSYIFQNCTSLEEVVTVNDGIFSGQTFQNCVALKEIKIPEGAKTIFIGSFKDCTSLSKIFLPVSLTSVITNAFSGCTALTDVYYAGGPEDWSAINFSTGNENLTNATIHYNFVDDFIGVNEKINELNEKIGDFSTALDSIIAQTDSIIGGNS